MGHSTTVYGWVAEYLAERFIEHPQWGQSRRIESIIPLALRRGHQRYIADPARKPHTSGTTMAARDPPVSVISAEMPPGTGDHIAAARKNCRRGPSGLPRRSQPQW